MKKNIVKMLLLLSFVILFSCKSKELKPFGAENIDYDKVEGINKNGPIPEMNHKENVPPMADKIIVENGPVRSDNSSVTAPPVADMDKNPDYGDVPIFVPAHKD